MTTPNQENAVSDTTKAAIPWREEPVHKIHYEDNCITVYSAAAKPASRNANIVYHSHSLDTIFVMLCTASARNEQPGLESCRITTTKGGVLVYSLTGHAPYVHRVRDHDTPLVFLGIEVTVPRTLPDHTHLTLSTPTAPPLTTGAGFATASHVSVFPCTPFPLLRERGPGILPIRTLLVPTGNDSVLSQLTLSLPSGYSVAKIEDIRLGFHISALLIRHKECCGFTDDPGSVLVNNGTAIWEGVLIDIWGTVENKIM